MSKVMRCQVVQPVCLHMLLTPFVSCGTHSKRSFQHPRSLSLAGKGSRSLHVYCVSFPKCPALWSLTPVLLPRCFTNLLCSNSKSFPPCSCTHTSQPCPLVFFHVISHANFISHVYNHKVLKKFLLTVKIHSTLQGR